MEALQEITRTKNVSSRWISEATGKRHDNVLRDIRNYSQKLGIDFLKTEESKNIKELLLPVEDAIILLSQYQGERAKKALKIVRLAVQYFILQSSEKNKTGYIKKQKKEKKHRVIIGEVTDLFGNKAPIYGSLKMTEMDELQKMQYQAHHAIQVSIGALKKAQSKSDRLAARIAQLKRDLCF